MAKSQTKPNILLMMADDIGWFDVGAYHRGIMGGQTPNIDRIAHEVLSHLVGILDSCGTSLACINMIPCAKAGGRSMSNDFAGPWCDQRYPSPI